MGKCNYLDFKVIKKSARELRKNMTNSEILDGPINETTIEYDLFRDDELKKLGLHILRLKNEELNSMDEALLKIKGFLEDII